MDLNMLSKRVREDNIRVELSIGNFGNISEADVEAGSSITSPAAPRFDGSEHFFIAWDSRKPLLQLNSQWEDIDYRIFTLNQLQHTAQILEDAAALVKTLLGRKDVPEMEISAVYDDVLLALREFCEVSWVEGRAKDEKSLVHEEFIVCVCTLILISLVSASSPTPAEIFRRA